MRGAHEIIIYIDDGKFPIKKWIETFNNLQYLMFAGQVKHFRYSGTPKISILFKNPDLKKFNYIKNRYKFFPKNIRIYFGITPSKFIQDSLISPHTKSLLFIQRPVQFACRNQDSLIRTAKLFASLVYPLHWKKWQNVIAYEPVLKIVTDNKRKIDKKDFFKVGKSLSKICPYYQIENWKLFPNNKWECFAIWRKAVRGLRFLKDGKVEPTNSITRQRVLIDNLYKTL